MQHVPRQLQALLPKVLIAAGLILLGVLALRFIIGVIKWLLIAVLGIGLLWIGARMLADRVPEE